MSRLSFSPLVTIGDHGIALKAGCGIAVTLLQDPMNSGAVVSKMEFVTQCATSSVHTELRYQFAQGWVLGGNSTKLACLVTITLRIYTVKNVSSAY